jgi:hypothetical protein
MILVRLALLLTVVAGAAAFAVALPDILRYLRMRSM